MKHFKGLFTLIALIFCVSFVSCEKEKDFENEKSVVEFEAYKKLSEKVIDFSMKLGEPKTIYSRGSGLVCANSDRTVLIHWVDGLLFRSVYNSSNAGNPWTSELILDFDPIDCSVNHRSADKVVCEYVNSVGSEDVTFTVYKRSNGTYYTKGVGEFSGVVITWDYAFDCPQK